MRCRRCHGLMVEQSCWERERWQVSSRWGKTMLLWHCLNCGECLDRTILRNREHCRAPVPDDRRRRIWRTIQQLCKEVAR